MGIQHHYLSPRYSPLVRVAWIDWPEIGRSIDDLIAQLEDIRSRHPGAEVELWESGLAVYDWAKP